MHRASITKRAVKGVYSLLQPSLVLQGEPPCWRSELGDMATTWGTEQTPYPKRKQREMGIMSIWQIYDKIFSDPIPGRWIHGEWRSCAPTPTKKKSVRGESQSKLFSHLRMCCVVNMVVLSRMTTSVFAFSAQIKQQTAVYQSTQKSVHCQGLHFVT